MNTPADPTAAPQAPAKKQSPLESALTPEQTVAFGQYLQGRIDSIKGQLSAEFWTKRRIYEQQMDDDFTWRSGGSTSRQALASIDDSEFADIFNLQNDSLNIVGGFAAFMTARTADDIFGTDPYYAINPEGIEDKDLADDMQKHSEWKLRMSPFKEAALDSLDLAMGLGEGVIKINWCRDTDVFEVEKNVLHIGGAPVVTMAGEYVYDTDLMEMAQEAEAAPVDDPTQQTDLGQMPPDQDPGAAPLPPPSPMMSTTKDPTMAFASADIEFKPMAVECTNVSYNGVEAATMHYKDFLCPLTAESLEKSDFVGHRFQLRLSEAKQRYNIAEDVAAQLATESEEAKAEAAKPRPDETAESGQGRPIPDPIIELVECWVKYDPVGDGRPRRCYVLVAMPLGLIVEMDYMANQTPQGQLPFFVVRGYKVKNRWYGRGYYEIYTAAQEYIDRQLNRIEYRNRFHSNPAVFFDQSKLVEDEEAGDFELRPGRTFMKKNGAKMEDIVEAWSFPDLDERTWQLMQFMIQTIQVRSGVTNAAQGEVSSMPSTATATGIESILQSASVLARLPMGVIRSSLEKALLYAVKLIYANFDRDEVYTFFEGDEQRARTLQAERVKNIDMNVRLLLTRFKQRDNLESAGKAIGIFTQYVTLPEQEKGPGRPLFIQALKGLGFDQADSIIRQPLPPPPMQPPGLPGQPPQPGEGSNIVPMQQPPPQNAAAQAGLPGIPAPAQ